MYNFYSTFYRLSCKVVDFECPLRATGFYYYTSRTNKLMDFLLTCHLYLCWNSKSVPDILNSLSFHFQYTGFQDLPLPPLHLLQLSPVNVQESIEISPVPALQLVPVGNNFVTFSLDKVNPHLVACCLLFSTCLYLSNIIFSTVFFYLTFFRNNLVLFKFAEISYGKIMVKQNKGLYKNRTCNSTELRKTLFTYFYKAPQT